MASAASQNHAKIKAVVTDFVRIQTATLPGKASYKVDGIDQRIMLPACPDLEAFLPASSQLIGKIAVGVRCPVENGWSIFVPVQIKISLNLLVSARRLSVGHVIQEQDLASQMSEISHPEGFTDPKEVLGKIMRYGITAGQTLREDMLRSPYSAIQGQVVQIASRGGGFSVRSEGVALNNASEGQMVQIRTNSGRVISGIARATGVVETSP